MSVLALDVGTTGVTALVVSEQGQVLRRGYQQSRSTPPNPAVSHEPEEIWQAVLAATRTTLCDRAGSHSGRRRRPRPRTTRV